MRRMRSSRVYMFPYIRVSYPSARQNHIAFILLNQYYSYVYSITTIFMSWYKRILWTLSTLGMIAINILATTLPFWGITTGELSDQLFTMITPAWLTFAIWSVIYLWLIVIMGLILWGKISVSRHVIWAYIVSCLANAWWIMVWHQWWLTPAMLLMIVLLWSLIMTDHYLQDSNDTTIKWMRSILLVYFGWVQIASLLMTTIYLTYGLEWITTETLWRSVLVIVLAWISNALVLWRARRIETTVVWLWALYGIYVWQSNPTIQTACLLVAGALLIGIGLHIRYRTNNQ